MAAKGLDTVAQEEAKIGPNAITQVAAALCAAASERKARELFAAVGQSEWLTEPPRSMVPETQVAALHQQVRRDLPSELAEQVLRDAGIRTGHYVLKRRIPAPVRALLKALPPLLAGPLLLRAIERNAWTFVGSATFRVVNGNPKELVITANPIVAGEHADQPICFWHAAVFQTLFRELVWRNASVHEVECGATGAPSCRFELRYR